MFRRVADFARRVVFATLHFATCPSRYYVAFLKNGNSIIYVPSRAHQEGRLAIVTIRWRGMRWTLVLPQDVRHDAYGQAVWS